jgi:hypothetical protein
VGASTACYRDSFTFLPLPYLAIVYERRERLVVEEEMFGTKTMRK